MVDLALNSDFSPYQDEAGNFPTVEDGEEVRQTVVLLLTKYLEDTTLGTTSEELIKQKIKLQVTRLAKEYDSIEGVTNLSIYTSQTEANTFVVEVGFLAIEDISFEVTV